MMAMTYLQPRPERPIEDLTVQAGAEELVKIAEGLSAEGIVLNAATVAEALLAIALMHDRDVLKAVWRFLLYVNECPLHNVWKSQMARLAHRRLLEVAKERGWA